MTFYSCKQTGHTSNHCKNAIENKAESIHFNSLNTIPVKNVSDLNKQKAQNTDSAYTNTDINSS